MKIKLDKVIVILTLLVVVGIAEAVLIGFIVIDSSAQITEVQRNIAAEDERKRRFNLLVKRYQEIEQEGIITAELDELLPDAEGFIDVINEIESLGKQSGVNQVVKLGQARLTKDGFELPDELRNQSVIGRTLPADAGYDFLEVDITVRGDYEEVLQFLNLFSQSSYYMNITSMKINRISNNKNIFIDTNLTVEIFVERVLFN